MMKNRIPSELMKKYGFKDKQHRNVREGHTINGTSTFEIELNGLYLEDAKQFIKDELKKIKKEEHGLIEFFHDPKRGKDLRDYVRSDEFKKDMKSLGLVVRLHSVTNEENTIISLK